PRLAVSLASRPVPGTPRRRRAARGRWRGPGPRDARRPEPPGRRPPPREGERRGRPSGRGPAHPARPIAHGPSVLDRGEDDPILGAHLAAVDTAHTADDAGRGAPLEGRRAPLEREPPAPHGRP